MDTLPVSAIDTLPRHSRSRSEIDRLWRHALSSLRSIFSKILVLDDDPTGSQTVYDLPVYTGFGSDDLLTARSDESHAVYVLTNSRSLHPPQSENLHRTLMRRWIAAGGCLPGTGETLVVSRSDSTLRGHYPLETDIITEELAAAAAVSGAPEIRGTILVPFFPEGGRFTFSDVHWVREGDSLIPAAGTEFASDSSFGYASSNMKDYVEEKTGGRITAENVLSISLETLRGPDISPVAKALAAMPSGGAVIVNAVDYDDLKVFMAALAEACAAGARFVLRSAAALVKVLAGLEDRPILERDNLFGSAAPGGPGFLIAGSYVGRTTRQLTALVECGLLAEVKLNIRHALRAAEFPAEIRRALRDAEFHLAAGRSVAVYTANGSRREFLRAAESPEDLTDLQLSARISAGLVDIVAGLETVPSWIVTKGGITSHDIAVRGLGIRKAMVLGQILPGVPVWRCGPESRFPGIPLVIFPGNVGDAGALARAVEKLV